ncbi:unnamed protein product, partial [Rotaria sp. Silwood1]
MTLYVQSLENDDGFDAEPGYAAFKYYHELREKRLNLEAEQSIYFLSEQRVEGDTSDPDEIIAPTLIRSLGPRFTYNDPQTASRRRTIELADLKRKIEARFFDKKLSPGRPVEQFIAELDLLLQKLHNVSINNQYQKHKELNHISFENLLSTIQLSQSQIKRLRYKLKLTNPILRKSDKSKVFHLGRSEDYQMKSEEHMVKTQAYKCLGTHNPLPDLIKRTNKYLLDLRLAKWITQKQYETLCINPNEVELPHLYSLPKAHKPGTPLRPIISGLKHPTIKISKYLGNLLRPIFDKMAFEDNSDLYTMVPQTGGVLSLKKILDYLKLKREAMGSPLTLTIANCYMFFYEQQIIKQISNSGGLYFRYIDDIFIAINWPARHLFKQIDGWNHFDENIKLSKNIDSTADFLDLHIENQDGQLFTTIFQKASYEPYYLPFNSIHPLHMKKNIIFTMLFRAIRYCSSFQTYLNELKVNINQPLTLQNYNECRKTVINLPIKEKIPLNYGTTMFAHFTYCS